MVIQKTFSGELDMLVEMREYVETYSDERYLPELYTVIEKTPEAVIKKTPKIDYSNPIW